ncbi:SMP-30/gluconolactonase/LRE family protein [Pseudomonadales bacterium]|jgi:gluconolactonase|nr:SMP-30/gluconolactonase/LRE family protein [Pseudomonadales bacterium]MDC1083964.1 SMP-30/gluconolactonase/LRE family protein [Pseudomonadales bacterium]MDC6449339.1 SMP-30/gluconolactonase/LRE family protein [Pseudomonadales bacterium]|tara:strand:+ start:354 stop:1256 length:903 start_codon:yes stop_codon:yes gene_type:complete
MHQITEITTGLQFPEGPIAMPDGSIIVVEIQRGTVSRVSPEGSIEVIATPGGGPNGAAIGPDGACYICNNGGFEWHERNSLVFPGDQPNDYSGGRIERVDLSSGEVSVLYTECNGNPLRGPNDIVFDRQGGFWFTDHGKNRPRDKDRTGVYYATIDGQHIREVIFPMEAPNGIGLSPAEDQLYVAETPTGRLWSFDISEPGVIDGARRMLAQIPDYHMFDSLAVDAEGNICVATLITGGITVHSPDGERAQLIEMPDILTTNICFGGEDLKTAYITLSSTGSLVSIPWHCAGLPLNFLNK